MMFFRKKLDRMLEIQKERAQASRNHNNYEDEEDVDLGTSDVLAIILSALLVFGPILLILFALMLWLV